MTRAHRATEGSVAQETGTDESVIPEPVLLAPVVEPVAPSLGAPGSGAGEEPSSLTAHVVHRAEDEAADVNGVGSTSAAAWRDPESNEPGALEADLRGAEREELPSSGAPEFEPGSAHALDPGEDEEVSADQLLLDDGASLPVAAPAISGVVPAPGLELGELPPSYPPSDPASDLEVPDSLEVGAVEVGLMTGEPSAEAAAPGERTSAPGFHAPWVDEVPDAVTPYEQRHSETVKLAELPPIELLRGRVVANRYLVEEFAERTPAGVSYRAYHLALDRAVTLRVLPRGLACSDELCQEVRRVARLATELEHPHIAGTLDFGVTNDGWPFLVSEHYSGRTLAALLADEGKFVLRRVLHIGKHVAAALQAAQQVGLTHGLLTPDNIMVIEPGTSAEVGMLLGFGVAAARGVAPGPPRSGVFGVPFYVSPEQASCKATDARSDLYAVGVILYELMTGVPPFVDGDFAAVLCQHLDEEPAPPSSRLRSPGALAKAMDAIIERCLRKDPDKRYQSAADLGEDLARLEAAAARNKRRPMPEIQRPTTTIHTPPPRVDSLPPGAKVIVNSEAEAPLAERSSPNAAMPVRSATPPPVAVRPQSAATSAGARPAVARRVPRASAGEATIRITAHDRELAMARYNGAEVRQSWGTAFHGFGAALTASFALLIHWFIGRARRLVDGVRGVVAAADERDAPRNAPSSTGRDEPPRS